MKVGGIGRAVALYFLAIGLHSPLINAGTPRDSKVVNTLTLKDLIDFIGKLGDPSNPPSLVEEVVVEVEIFLVSKGISHPNISKGLMSTLENAVDLRKRLLKDPNDYGKYSDFDPSKGSVVKYASDVVNYIAILRSDLWFLYFTTSDVDLRRLCLLATIFHVPTVLAAAEGATLVVSSTAKDMMDFLGKLEMSSIKDEILTRFGEKLKDYLEGIGFKATEIQWNLTALLETIPELRLMLLEDPKDFGRFKDVELSIDSVDKYADALAHCLPVLHGELWMHYLDTTNVVLKRLCLRALGLRGPVSFNDWEQDLLNRSRADPNHAGRNKAPTWKLYIWGGIFLVLLIGGPTMYYIYKRPRKCDLCRGCSQCCRCQSKAHCCCFCFRFWNRSTCEQCQLCTTCRSTQKCNICLIMFFELLLAGLFMALPIVSVVSALKGKRT